MAWLSVVGIGEEGLQALSPRALEQIEKAEILVGGRRHLRSLEIQNKPFLIWETPLRKTLDRLKEWRGRPVCVLATGDPFCYGVGTTLTRFFTFDEMIVIPAPSAFSLACSRLGWPLEEVDVCSLHGRSITLVHPFLQPENRILALATDRHTARNLGEYLREREFGNSEMILLEHLGGKTERLLRIRANQADSLGEIADFYTIGVICRSDTHTFLPRVPGLPDDAFRHDGMITKREVRAITLSALAPAPGQTLWDIGAGCGSIGIEWLRCEPRAQAFAIEREPERVKLIERNRHLLGCPDLRIIAEAAPECLNALPQPQAIFIGGGLSDPDCQTLLEVCWRALCPRGGRLVANAITLEAEAALLSWRAANGGSLSRLNVSRAAPLGPYQRWTPFHSVLQYSSHKIITV